MILYCKNTIVYDVDRNKVYNIGLLPGYLKNVEVSPSAFDKWMKMRYSSQNNAFARELLGHSFGQGGREVVNEKTHALSLSDCYWVKSENENLDFYEISPYYVDFWKGEGDYNGLSIPTLYTSGDNDKKWINSNTLLKYGEHLKKELDVLSICVLLGIKCSGITLDRISNKGLLVFNFTNTDVMYESVEMSGLLSTDNGYTGLDIVDLFQDDGFKMLLLDALVGNIDRHLGSFGFLRSADTGKYIGMAPLYNFDHSFEAVDDVNTNISDLLWVMEQYPEYRYICVSICLTMINMKISNKLLDTAKKRAETILFMLT